MTLANPIRVASLFRRTILLGTVLCGATPASLLASGAGQLQSQPPQAAPAKPSADVPQNSSLPPTQPTENPSAKPAVEPVVEHFDVEFSGGMVTIDATNASLNKLIHEVGAKAAIKVTGSVSDERVFGHYGPASPSVVLAMLLDGTGANMLLVDGPKGGSELVLTQRAGGPSPPNPIAAALETSTDEEGRPTSRYVNPGRGFQPPGPGGRGPAGPPPNFGPPAAPGGAGQGDAAQSSSDTRTPQQIYEQLQNASQQKPQ